MDKPAITDTMSQAVLFATIDEAVAAYTASGEGMAGRQAALRTPAAAWSMAFAHAEHRMKQNMPAVKS